MDEGWRDVRCTLAPCRGFSNANKKLTLKSPTSLLNNFWCRYVAVRRTCNHLQAGGLRMTPRREKYSVAAVTKKAVRVQRL